MSDRTYRLATDAEVMSLFPWERSEWAANKVHEILLIVHGEHQDWPALKAQLTRLVEEGRLRAVTVRKATRYMRYTNATSTLHDVAGCATQDPPFRGRGHVAPSPRLPGRDKGNGAVRAEQGQPLPLAESRARPNALIYPDGSWMWMEESRGGVDGVTQQGEGDGT